MAEFIFYNTLQGIGTPGTQLTPITGLNGIALMRPGVSFTNAADIATKATWDAKIASKDIFIIPNVKSDEAQTTEDRIKTTDYGDKIWLGSGIRGKRLLLTLSLDAHKLLQAYSDLGWTMMKFDRNNHIHAVLNSDNTITGFSLSYFHVYDQLDPQASEPAYTPVEYQEEDASEWNGQGFHFSPTWRVSSLKPIKLVTITSSTVASFKFTVVVSYTPTSTVTGAGAASSIPLSGLVAADFEVIDQTGATEVVTAAESATVVGTYLITGVDITSGTVRVKPSATNLHESALLTITAA